MTLVFSETMETDRYNCSRWVLGHRVTYIIEYIYIYIRTNIILLYSLHQ